MSPSLFIQVHKHKTQSYQDFYFYKRKYYKIPKKEEVVEQQQAEPDNPLMRKKKTPEELAAEAELEDQDEFTKLKNTIETQVNELKSQIESKCVMQ
ncbi:unnamed protein product [Spodoptera littoralis]|uniref:Complexin n=1 Tax=Spodoptera littoralis TaxID=7109 RepID=A0A9P0I6Z9_SPOLI|nr:unnamed protein product [Spodoptera littoralis]CAH1641358.1 unnamed protein product [Spodoptera littoralis]